MASVATADVSVTAAAAAAIGMPTASSKVLYIGGLDEAVTPALLQAAFVPFGDLVAVDVPLHAATQKARGFGFVEFGDEADARDAMLNMDGAELYGRVLRVRPAEGGRRLGGNKAVWAAADDWYARLDDGDGDGGAGAGAGAVGTAGGAAAAATERKDAAPA